MSSIVVYTDIDGTFVDEEYSYKEAIPALSLIKEKRIPLVFCTSKTRAEIEVYRGKLGINDPFISENGGAIFIPEGYFSRKTSEKIMHGYEVIELGTPYAELRKALAKVGDFAGCRITGLGDMSVEELSGDSGLAPREAKLAKMREYDEAFKIKGTKRQIDKALELIESSGFNHTRGGRYYHIMGDNDKGRAVRILTDLYKSENTDVKAIGLGDSYNDIPMLDNVDIPILIKRPDGTFVDSGRELVRSRLPGPAGWNEVILEMLL